MFGGAAKAEIAGKVREIELITSQLEETKSELNHVKTQLERVYSTVLGLNEIKLNRPEIRGRSDGVG